MGSRSRAGPWSTAACACRLPKRFLRPAIPAPRRLCRPGRSRACLRRLCAEPSGSLSGGLFPLWLPRRQLRVTRRDATPWPAPGPLCCCSRGPTKSLLAPAPSGGESRRGGAPRIPPLPRRRSLRASFTQGPAGRLALSRRRARHRPQHRHTGIRPSPSERVALCASRKHLRVSGGPGRLQVASTRFRGACALASPA